MKQLIATSGPCNCEARELHGLYVSFEGDLYSMPQWQHIWNFQDALLRLMAEAHQSFVGGPEGY